MELPENAREDIMNFQQIQQQLQMLMLQKQNIQIQTIEIENALKELEKAGDKEVFEVVGNIMVKKQKKELVTSLKEKQDLFGLRTTTLDKQLEELNKKARELQKKLSSYLGENK